LPTPVGLGVSAKKKPYLSFGTEEYTLTHPTYPVPKRLNAAPKRRGPPETARARAEAIQSLIDSTTPHESTRPGPRRLRAARAEAM